MRPFKAGLFGLLEGRVWWLQASTDAKAAWLVLLDEACRAGGLAAPGVYKLAYMAGMGADIERSRAALAELLSLGAATLVETYSGHYYELDDFEAFADSLDTHRALSRKNYRRKRQEQTTA